MAQLNSAVEFTGRIQNLTYYKRRGSDKIIVRHNTGVSKEKIKKDKAFAGTRNTNNEFKALNLVSKNIYHGLSVLHPVMDHNVYNQLLSRSRMIQKLDLSNPGKRSVLLSQHGHLYEQLQFNKKCSLESIWPFNIEHQIDPSNRSASINIPSLIPGVQFINRPNLPFFRIFAVLQSIPDICWANKEYSPSKVNIIRELAYSGWQQSHLAFPGRELTMEISGPSKPGTLLLSLGIVFGKEPGTELNYLGAGKILAVMKP